MRRLWTRWLPWRWIVRNLAQAEGFLDPLTVLSRLRRFAHPAEVIAPTELLRAGAIMHARGLMNSQAIQHNLDWIWPYWVIRQFTPHDEAFLPWAFSVSHLNLTHRNWTAIGLPDIDALPLVDPRGLVTPLFDGWSLDGWIVGADGAALLPSKAAHASQTLEIDDRVTVTTTVRHASMQLVSCAEVVASPEGPVCRLTLQGSAHAGGWLVVALRPFNPEGVSFVHQLSLDPTRTGWRIDRRHDVRFSQPADRHALSNYQQGDVFSLLPAAQDGLEVVCDVGMATAAAAFALSVDAERTVTVDVPLPTPHARNDSTATVGWSQALEGHAALSIPDARLQFLYDAALRTLILHAPSDVYPGPYTYKRFWFRDAAFILHAMLCAGMTSRAERVLDRFPSRQTPLGYFLSQDGEWDANGEALWIFHRFCELTGRAPKAEWLKPIERAAHWIKRKRLPADGASPHAGLLPPGFSAEHLGPNDYYYWDDFWSVEGLRAAAAMAAQVDRADHASAWTREADDLMRCIERSLAQAQARLRRPAMPAAPYRRLDAGAIGSITAGYPLQLWAQNDPRVLDTAEFLLERCFVDGGFFQTMSHSGINPYLTLHVAQVLLRAGDRRCVELLNTIAGLATSTGQWPEAIHPRTKGGCMGDGQHVWAVAEWVMMMRNSFVREEPGRLVLAGGIPSSWYAEGEVSFGPAPTTFGPITVSVKRDGEDDVVTWDAAWRAASPVIEVRPLGREPLRVEPGRTSARWPTKP